MIKPKLRCKLFGHKWQYESDSKRSCVRCGTCHKLDRVCDKNGVIHLKWVRDEETEDVIKTLNNLGL